MAEDNGFSSILKKAAFYTSTCIFAMVIGYFLGFQKFADKVPIFSQDNFLLLCPMFLSYPFIVAWTSYVHYEDSSSKKTAFFISIAFAIIFSLIIYLLAGYGRNYSSPIFYMLYIIIYAALCLAYGAILLLKNNNHSYPLIHKLVWPVLLSISVSLYFGFTTPKLLFSPDPIAFNFLITLLPIAILIIMFITLEYQKSVLHFIFYGSSYVLLWAVIFVFLPNIKSYTFDEYFITTQQAMLFYISIGAYLAFFESWLFSAEAAKKNLSNNNACKITYTDQASLNSCDCIDKPSLGKLKKLLYSRSRSSTDATWPYYTGSLISIVVAFYLVPFVYIFSENKLLFLVSFFFISAAGTWLWAVRGSSSSQLLDKRQWERKKTLFGWLFLIFFAADSYRDIIDYLKKIIDSFVISGGNFTNANKHIISISAIAALIGISMVPAKSLYKAFLNSIKSDGAINWKTLFCQRRNVFRLGSCLGILFLLIVFFITIFGISESQKVNAKVIHIIIFYGILLLILFFMEGTFTILDKIQSSILVNENIDNQNTKIDNLLQENRLISSKQIIKDKIIGIFATIRLYTCAVIGISVMLPGISKGIGFTQAFLDALPFMLAAMGGFAVNDFYDRDKDKTNKPWRPIPRGQISPSDAKTVGNLLLYLSVVSVFVSADTISKLFFITLSVVGVYFYNVVVKKAAYLKTIYTAIICCLPLFYNIVVYSYESVFLLVPFSAIIFLTGRELLMDCLDIEGDHFGASFTIPMLLGIRRTESIAFLFQFLSIMLLLPFVTARYNNICMFAILTVLMISTICYFIWMNSKSISKGKIIKVMHIQFLIGIAFFLI